MKTTSYLFVLGLSVALFSCGGQSDGIDANKAGTEAEATTESATYTVDNAKSTVNWHGSKLTGEHSGTIQIQSGSLSVEGGNVTAGEFVIDMNTLKETVDESNEEAKKYAAKLEGHLKSADFFEVETYPTSKFVITKVEGDNVSGNLTIKGITKEISFPATINVTDNEVTASAEFTINRADWEVKYGSSTFFDDLGDKVISNDIDYKINLVASK